MADDGTTAHTEPDSFAEFTAALRAQLEGGSSVEAPMLGPVDFIRWLQRLALAQAGYSFLLWSQLRFLERDTVARAQALAQERRPNEVPLQ